MSPLNFAIIALRILGFYFVVDAVPLFSTASLISVIEENLSKTPEMPHVFGFTGIDVFLAFLPTLLELVMGLLILIFAVPLARRLVPPVPIESEKTACSFEEVQAIVFAAVGILVLTNAFPDLGRAVMSLYAWYGMPSADRDIASANFHGDWIHAIGVVAQAIVGLFLLLSPQGFRNAWRFLRTAGTRPRSEISG